MLKPPHYIIPRHVIERITHLTMQLEREAEVFHSIASSVKNHQWRDSIGMLAQTNTQYAQELKAQLNFIARPVIDTEITFIDPAGEITPLFPAEAAVHAATSLHELFKTCIEKEKLLICLYREILNEPHLGEENRRMIRYQLNGIMYAFLNLKLLDTVSM